MYNLRIIELEQQLKRRDERLQTIETKVNDLLKYEIAYAGNGTYEMEENEHGLYIQVQDIQRCFK